MLYEFYDDIGTPETFELIERSRALREKTVELRYEIRAAVAEARRNRRNSYALIQPDGVATKPPHKDAPVDAKPADAVGRRHQTEPRQGIPPVHAVPSSV